MLDIQQIALEYDKIDIERLLTELQEWQRELDHDWEDEIRYAMIDTFIDMVIDNLIQGDD